MINGLFFLQFRGFYGGGGFGDLLNRLDTLGFFDYLLPFLLIFAIIFGVLSKVKIFEDNRGISGVIALSVSLMALQFGLVSEFFSVIFPKVGIGLAVILLLLIFLGFSGDEDGDKTKWVFWGVGIVIAIIILADTFEESFLWNNNLFLGSTVADILLYAFIIIIVSLIIFGGKSKENPIAKALKPIFRN